MGSPQKQKGSAFERECAKHLNKALGVSTIRRAPLSGGGNRFSGKAAFGTTADLTGKDTHDIHFECKRVEALSFPAALRQAKEACKEVGEDRKPVVVNRRSRQALGEAYVLMEFDDFIEIWKNHLHHLGKLPT